MKEERAKLNFSRLIMLTENRVKISHIKISPACSWAYFVSTLISGKVT